MRTNETLDYALWYAQKGISVFPLIPRGKEPLTKNSFKNASTNDDQIKTWWNRRPAANIGIATGVGAVPLLVLDVDVGHGAGHDGLQTIKELEEEHGKLPMTWVCKTGGGGLHYYFHCADPELTTGVNVLPGLDFRGLGGYAVAPPSIHKSGTRYEWTSDGDPRKGVQLAELPGWLADILKAKKSDTTGFEAADIPAIIPEGGRNSELFRLASSLRAKGLSETEMLAALAQINEERCDPPLSDGELKTICHSASRYERGTATRAIAAEGVKPNDFSDAGNAEVFTRIYRDDLFFTDALGWLYWDGTRWQRDDHRATTMALELSAAMLGDALKENRATLVAHAEAQARFAESGDPVDADAVKRADADKKAAKAYLTHAQHFRGASRIKGMLDLSKPAMVIRADQLDADPFALNTPGGIVNLKTGEIRPHDRVALCSQITAVGPSDDGTALWRDFLDKISCGDRDIQSFLQQVAGMSLIGAVYQEGIVLAYGGGRNGKSTFFNALAAVLGDYAGSVEVSTLTTDRGNRGASLATLRGKRLVVTGELEEHQRLSVATLKRIASTDSLVIEEKYKSPETVKQTHTLTLFTNHLPRVGSTDNGTWRRLIVVPFNATIPPGEGVQNFAQVLTEQAGGAILSWMVEGAVNFVRNGYKLDVPSAVADATREYREREDWLNNFIDERCIKKPGVRSGARDLYLEYKMWAEDSGEFVRRENDFSVAMSAAGYQKQKISGRFFWVGLSINNVDSSAWPSTVG